MVAIIARLNPFAEMGKSGTIRKRPVSETARSENRFALGIVIIIRIVR